jgi:nucleotide-binding universal stress UspA family protein
MTPLLIFLVVVAAAAALGAGALLMRDRRRSRVLRPSGRRILFPFAGTALSQRALQAALRLARVEGATLVPAYLVQVPLRVSLDGPLPRQCEVGMPVLEAIEQQAAAVGVLVDARIGRGRTYRHALRDVMEHERYDRIVVAAAGPRTEGFHGDDIAWLLDTAPGEVVVVRPDNEDHLAGNGDRFAHVTPPRIGVS